MARSVPELAEILYLLIASGLILSLAYVASIFLSRRAKKRYRTLMRETERSLIGQRVLVTKTIEPPESGEIVPLNGHDGGDTFKAYARQVLWAGQRARVVSTSDQGYLVAQIEKRKNP